MITFLLFSKTVEAKRGINNFMMMFSGFAFILMEDSRDAEDAVKELDGTRICGRRVKVELPSCPGPSVDHQFEDLH